jgi:hypothetical protein
MANNQNFKSFTKGDTRINRRGRPKEFDLIRRIATKIQAELVPYGPDGYLVTSIEAILRDWADSDEFKKQLAFVQYAFGKVPKNDAYQDRDVQIVVNWDNVVTASDLARKGVVDYNPNVDVHPPLLNPY